MSDQTDDELFEELMDDISYLPFSEITPENVLIDKKKSMTRLESCLDCDFNKNLFCEKRGVSVLTLIKLDGASCPIGEW